MELGGGLVRVAALNIGRDNFDKRGNDLGRHVGVGVGHDTKRVARLQKY